MSHSDDVTSSSTLLNHPSGDGFGESLCFSGFTAMSGSQREELWCGGNEGVRRLEVWNLSLMNVTAPLPNVLRAGLALVSQSNSFLVSRLQLGCWPRATTEMSVKMCERRGGRRGD